MFQLAIALQERAATFAVCWAVSNSPYPLVTWAGDVCGAAWVFCLPFSGATSNVGCRVRLYDKLVKGLIIRCPLSFACQHGCASSTRLLFNDGWSSSQRFIVIALVPWKLLKFSCSGVVYWLLDTCAVCFGRTTFEMAKPLSTQVRPNMMSRA